MGEECVFLDRDRTVIEDPGYLTDPSAVKLLPGVDVALRSLADAGFKLVIVTNQSGVARGMLTEEALEHIHSELRRQLAEKGVHLAAIYYCPYHPEGTVEEYARDSEERKPRPGMLLRAARELNLDLDRSWMVGDTPADVEAGQRAGCRTIRIRLQGEEGPREAPTAHRDLDSEQDEAVQADFTVRNLVDAARMILRTEAAGTMSAAPGLRLPVGGVADAAPAFGQASRMRPEDMSDSEVLREILQHLRRLGEDSSERGFSVTRLLGTMFQVLAVIAFLVGLVYLPGTPGSYEHQIAAHLALLVAGVLQAMALSFFILARRR